ncbi:MAG: tRNA pseudouridine(55) synthase TruB [Rhodoglobus sp.]
MAKRPPTNPTSGILLVDKPQGMTSHDVVARVRRGIGTRKVGHAGTLDPMATGLLVLGINSSTRLLTWVVGLDKQYLATIRLGFATTTDDAEGEALEAATSGRIETITDDAITAGLARLTGDILQRPSSVSAIKVDGKRAYALVRAGEEVDLPERPVTVSSIDIVDIRRGEYVDVDVVVNCSSGTYIRAIARDLGESLRVGGHLTALRRTRIGPFAVDAASGLDDELAPSMLKPAAVASELFPVAHLTVAEGVDLGNGKRIPIAVEGGPIAAVDDEGRLVGLVENVAGKAKVLVNFPRDAEVTEP